MDYFEKNGFVIEEALNLEYEQIESQLLSIRDENGDLMFIVEEDLNSTSIIYLYKDFILTVLFNYCSIVWLAVLTRTLHFIVDLTKPNSDLKDFITCTVGGLQLKLFIDKVGIDHGHILIFSVIVTYFTYVKFVNLLFIRRESQEKNKSSNRWPQSFISPIVILTPILINEYCIHIRLARTNTFLRGILMTLAMKATSQLSTPHIRDLSILSYFLHPASCLFGPWHDCRANSKVLDRSHFTTFKQQIVKSSKLFIQSITILIISDCLLDHLVERVEHYQAFSNLWSPPIVFVRALQFRCSHYSISYLTFSLLSLWADPEDESKICNILKVEWPRSLVQVVISWNIPMHSWLKEYIFEPSRSYFKNTPLAIFITYLVSSILHGFKFHICAVLLSLGFLTLVEFRLRKKLSRRLNICILAKNCKLSPEGNCVSHHMSTSMKSVQAKLVNLLFSILAISHLAYLGYIFKGDTDQASLADALDAWKSLYYYSPILGLVTYIINFCLI